MDSAGSAKLSSDRPSAEYAPLRLLDHIDEADRQAVNYQASAVGRSATQLQPLVTEHDCSGISHPRATPRRSRKRGLDLPSRSKRVVGPDAPAGAREQTDRQTESAKQSQVLRRAGREVCGRRDLNPGSAAWRAAVLTRLDDDRPVQPLLLLT